MKKVLAVTATLLLLSLFVMACRSSTAPTAATTTTKATTTTSKAATTPSSTTTTPKAATTTSQTATTTTPKATTTTTKATTYQLRVGNSMPPSLNYSAGVKLSEIVSNYTNVKASPLSLTGGTPAHIDRLRAGEIEVGQAGDSSIYQAFKGIKSYEGKAIPDLVALNFFNPGADFYMVRADSGITKLEDLNNKKFGPAALGTAVAARTREVLDALGIRPQYVEASFEEHMNMTRENRIVGFVKSGSGIQPDPMVIQLNGSVPLRVLGFSDEQKQIIQQKLPYYSWFTVPTKDFGKEGQVGTIGSNLGWTTRKALVPDEAAYQFVKAQVEHLSEFYQSFPNWPKFDMVEITMASVKGASLPLHPGAAKYFQERGYKTP